VTKANETTTETAGDPNPDDAAGPLAYLFHIAVLIRWSLPMKDEQLVVQMSGAPGAGKTTIAHELVRRLGLIALDHDVVKSAVLHSGGTFETAGPISYGVLFALASDLLEQGFGVIIDSPCYYDDLLAAGRKLAAAPGRAYRYIECVTEDIDVLDRRLRARTGLRSQRPSVNQPPPDLAVDRDATGAALFRAWIAGMKRPERFLRLDTIRPLAACVDDAMAYLASGAAPATSR
jgi:predicted kinase